MKIAGVEDLTTTHTIPSLDTSKQAFQLSETSKQSAPVAETSKQSAPVTDTPKPATTGKRGPRGPRTQKVEEHVLYCLDTGKREGGNFALSKPGEKKEILAQAYKTGVHYFRLQKFQALIQETAEGKFELVEVPVE